jgi:uncharacterized protein (TIGR01777 family)
VTIFNELPENSSPKLFLSASATGIYPDNKFQNYTEFETKKGNGFLAEVVSKWEAEANELVNPSVRLVICRLGVVLSRDGGMLKLIMPIFRLGLGGIIGSGKQVTTFIHIDDLLEAFLFFIKNEKTSGIFNLVTPNPITNREFTKILSKKLHRPALLRVPAFILTLLYGKASCIMLDGSDVYPQKLINQGFSFSYPTFEDAIDHELN